MPHEPSEKTSGDSGGQHSGRQFQHGKPDQGGGRGNSIQGEQQNARGGPQGANQGGAPRGTSRLDPSHAQRAQKQDKGGSRK